MTNKQFSPALYTFVLLFTVMAPSIYAQQVADTILINGNIYSLDWGEPARDGTPAKDAPFHNGTWHADASAIAISDSSILQIGELEQVKAFIGDGTQVIDLQGATVIPGLIDSHVHIAELGEILQRVNLSDVASPQAAIEKLQQQSDSLDDDEWLIGQGWDEGAWANNYPNRQMLDQAFPDNPVYLRSLHGFAVWVNSRALRIAGVTKDTEAPVGGEILRDEHGLPSGILLNRATTLIADAIPKPEVQQFASYIKAGMEQMAQDGFVAVHEAGAESLHIAALQHLKRNEDLPIRMYAMLSARDQALAAEWQQRGPLTDPDGFLDIRAVKAYYDGALGSRGARLLDDYSDRPGHKGVSGENYGFDGEIVDKFIEAGFQVGIHAIGDAGNRETLDYFTAAQSKTIDSIGLRHRIEHAQVLQVDDIQRFNKLMLIASMEPPHAVEDKQWAEERLGAERILGAYAWRTLRQQGAQIIFNSDLPGSDHNIFYGLHAAVTRRDKESQPTEGWYPEQSLTMEEAIRAYTHWAAYSAFRETETGLLKKGYWADLTIMNIDPFELATENPSAILEGEILMTVVGGEIVHQSKN